LHALAGKNSNCNIVFFNLPNVYPFLRYQNLATATEEKAKDKDDNIVSGKKIVADWVLVLGETASQIHVLQNDQSKDAPCKIVVLGSRTLFVLHHSGVLSYSKKLDFASVTMLPYPSSKIHHAEGVFKKRKEP
jgi:hypothetical protein